MPDSENLPAADRAGPLADVRVLDLSSVIAGPGCARHLADFGADVIKVERRGRGDSSRNLGWRDPADGQTFFFKLANRNKRCIELDLKSPHDRDRLLELVDEAHVVVENMRPGKLEALGLGPEVLLARRPELVITRVTAFGQTGPMAGRPGFATMAEAMSGFAALNGAPDGPPTLPPVAVTDETTAIAAAFATMVALHSGRGQVVDVSLIETMVQLMGPLPGLFLTTGEQQGRLGSALPYSVPRGTYRTSDGRWVAVSSSADAVAARVMELIGLGDEESVRTAEGRRERSEEIETRLVEFVAERSIDEVITAFTAADAAAAEVYDIEALVRDPHIVEREVFTQVDGHPMPRPLARLSETPGEVRWPGRSLGADNDLLDG